MRAFSPGTGVVTAVNVGRPAAHEWLGRTVVTAIFKEPVHGPVPLRGVNLAGDDQADREVHGGPDKAVYAYAAEDIAWWEGAVGRPLGPAPFGENLTTRGLELGTALVGDRWEVGSALLEVCQPRLPCFKLGLRMADRHFPRRFAAALRPGVYLRIIAEGEFAAGDPITVVTRPDHDVTVTDVIRAYYEDRSLAARLLTASALPETWAGWARERRE